MKIASPWLNGIVVARVPTTVPAAVFSGNDVAEIERLPKPKIPAAMVVDMVDQAVSPLATE